MKTLVIDRGIKLPMEDKDIYLEKGDTVNIYSFKINFKEIEKYESQNFDPVFLLWPNPDRSK